MVSSGPSQPQAGLGPHTSMQGPVHMRAASGAYGSRKGHIPASAYAALRQDALCPALKPYLLYLVPYFLNTLCTRLKRDVLAAQSSCRKQRPEPRSNALPAQDRRLSQCAGLWFSQGATTWFNHGADPWFSLRAGQWLSLSVSLWRADGLATWRAFARATKKIQASTTKRFERQRQFLPGRIHRAVLPQQVELL